MYIPTFIAPSFANMNCEGLGLIVCKLSFPGSRNYQARPKMICMWHCSNVKNSSCSRNCHFSREYKTLVRVYKSFFIFCCQIAFFVVVYPSTKSDDKIEISCYLVVKSHTNPTRILLSHPLRLYWLLIKTTYENVLPAMRFVFDTWSYLEFLLLLIHFPVPDYLSS